MQFERFRKEITDALMPHFEINHVLIYRRNKLNLLDKEVKLKNDIWWLICYFTTASLYCFYFHFCAQLGIILFLQLTYFQNYWFLPKQLILQTNHYESIAIFYLFILAFESWEKWKTTTIQNKKKEKERENDKNNRVLYFYSIWLHISVSRP